MNDKVNIFINSKNRDLNETASSFTVRIPNNLLRLSPDEYFTLNVNAFHCFNNWYNCIIGFNSQFQLIYTKDNGEITTVISFDLQEGNPSVLQVKSNLNQILTGHVSIEYDMIKNKFLFKRTKVVDADHRKLYLKVINSEDFLGFYKKNRNELIELPYNTSIYSYNTVNVIGDESIAILIDGDVAIDNTCAIDNFGDVQYKPSNIIFVKAIDAPSTALLSYNNEDGGDSFQFRLANVEQITWFKLAVINQDYEAIPNFNDYILNLQFVKHKKHNEMALTLKKLLEYIQDLFMLISNQIFKV